MDHVEMGLLQQLVLGVAEHPAERRIDAQETPADREQRDAGRGLLEQGAEQRRFIGSVVPRCYFRPPWLVNHDIDAESWAPGKGWGAPTHVTLRLLLVGLLAQERRDVVLVDARSAAAPRPSRRGCAGSPPALIELLVVDRARQVVGSGLLGRNVVQHELRLRLPRRRCHARGPVATTVTRRSSASAVVVHRRRR